MNVEDHSARTEVLGKLEALETALRALGSAGSAEVLDSIRRLARSLSKAAGRADLHELSGDAMRLCKSGEDGLKDALAQLLDRAQTVRSQHDEAEETLLVVEDDPGTAMILCAVLASTGRRTEVAETLPEAERLLQARRVSLVVLDLELTAEDGRDFLERLKSNPRTRDIAVLVTTVKESPMTKTECYALGADGYFQKPIDFETLSAAVQSRLRHRFEIRSLVYGDPLTGLLNRVGLTNGFERLIKESNGTSPSLALIDIDRFKQINDENGHATGDHVLVSFAEVLRRTFRETDLLARWGGDEFAILLRATTSEAAAGSVRRALSEFREVQFRGVRRFRATFSAGVAQLEPNEDLDRLTARADGLLYRAKVAGRNRVVTADDPISHAQSRVVAVLEDGALAQAFMTSEVAADYTIEHGDLDELGEVSTLALVIANLGGSIASASRVVEAVRAKSSAPIIGIADARSDEETRELFELDIADLVLLPASPSELIGRARAALRRR